MSTNLNVTIRGVSQPRSSVMAITTVEMMEVTNVIAGVMEVPQVLTYLLFLSDAITIEIYILCK